MALGGGAGSAEFTIYDIRITNEHANAGMLIRLRQETQLRRDKKPKWEWCWSATNAGNGKSCP
jgi:hypothetical protein